MTNELIFLLHLMAAGGLLVGAARLGRIWITSLIVICAVLMNIVVAKQYFLFGMAIGGGNVLYGMVFLSNDVLNEHYGRRAAREAVLIGFASGLVVVLLTQFKLWYAPNEFDDAQGHLSYFFGGAAYPRIVAASMVSYLLSQFIDIRIYSWLRSRTGTGRLLWLRSNASTWVSQAFDTVFFTTAGLTRLDGVLGDWVGTSGVFETVEVWRSQILFAFIIKIGVAVLDTPFLYLTTWRRLRPIDSQREAMLAAGRG